MTSFIFRGLALHVPSSHGSPELIWFHLLADVLILLAYVAIPASLVTILVRRKDIPFTWAFVCFAVFVGICGVVHAFGAWELWPGFPQAAIALEAVEAIAAVATTVLLIRLVPKMLALPSPAALQRVNAVLEQKIAEHERAEALLSESNRRLNLLSKATTDVVWDWDMSRDTVWWNENYEVLFGYTPAEAGTDLGSWSARIHPDDAPAVHDTLQAVLERGEDTWSGEYRYRRRDGSWVHLFDRGYVVRDEQGRPVRMLGAMQDISARKQAEAEAEVANQQLLDVSRQAGMAEVATGVLHSAGNVLNSVNVSATLIADHVRRSRSATLEKAAALLREHQNDLPGFLTRDPRGRELPAFLETLAGHLEKERATLLGEIASLRANVDHVREIVAMQQSYAKVSGAVERVALADIVEDALQLNAGLMARRDLTLTRDYQARPVVLIDKHKALSILVNLIRNAVAACDESGRNGDKRITLRITTGDRHASVEVTDNGVGISPENLSRIFVAGFTTRTDARGFGLHNGAIAAKQLGGSLVVRSEGPGRGAVSIFSLPLAPEPAPRG